VPPAIGAFAARPCDETDPLSDAIAKWREAKAAWRVALDVRFDAEERIGESGKADPILEEKLARADEFEGRRLDAYSLYAAHPQKRGI
jgi:hypothetical protein